MLRRVLALALAATALTTGCGLLPGGPEPLRVSGADVLAGEERYLLEAVSHYLVPFYLTPDGGADQSLRDTTERTFADREETFERLRAFGADTVRVPLGGAVTQGGDPYDLGGVEGVAERAVEIVEAAEDADLRVVFGWWDSLQQTSSWPQRYTEAFPQMKAVVEAVGERDNVTYEPWNEPNQVSEADWQATTIATLEYFREDLGYRGVLWVDTNDYSDALVPESARAVQDADAALLGGPAQVVFANHRYALQQTCFCGEELADWERTVGQHVEEFPVAGTEYGYWNAQGPPQPQWNEELFAHLRSEAVPRGMDGVGVWAWDWVDQGTMTQGGGELTEWGRLVRDELFRPLEL